MKSASLVPEAGEKSTKDGWAGLWNRRRRMSREYSARRRPEVLADRGKLTAENYFLV
jgi:hypothetical protein